MSGTFLQWLTMGGWGWLLGMCLWYGRRRRLRPAAFVLGLWAANGLAFYVVLLMVYGAEITPGMVAWSALTRWQGILLGIVALVVLAQRDREG